MDTEQEGQGTDSSECSGDAGSRRAEWILSRRGRGQTAVSVQRCREQTGSVATELDGAEIWQ